MAQKHICGGCGGEYGSEDLYLNHSCPKTNAKPVEAANLGKHFAKVQEAALKRGAERVES